MDEQSIFLGALQKETPEERAAFLAEACGNDEGVRQEVEMLLKAHAKVGDFLQGAPAGTEKTFDQPPLEKPGTQIGPYKLLQQIGEGGMGVVYMAEQHKPLHRRVALKIIKPGMDTSAVIARFEAERQALALMDHPNIAKVFDAGTTDSGRPFFVMELIQGIAITDYCDRNAVPIPERLDLFLATCRGVQHAHHRGVIHRDIKPGNVLVTLHDGVPVVNTGDWPAFFEEVSKLTLPENADFHERLFYWHAQLEVHESAADGLKQIVAEYPQSALARATYALALVDPVGTNPRPDQAIAEAVRAADDGPLSSLVALALIRTYVVAAREADGPRRTELIEEALKHAPLLERLPNYTSGRLALAELYDLAGQRALAESHFEACGFPDIIAAVFARDRDDRRLQIARGKWGDSPIARLNSLLVDIGKKPNADVLRGYRALMDDARASTAVRAVALQVPFRLREFEMAANDARSVRDRLHTPAELHLLKISDIGLPLELGADAGSASSRLARARRTGSKADKLLADFWEGHLLLGQGDAAGAKVKFQDCINNWIGFNYNYWARYLLDRLEENPNWPNPPPAFQ